MIVIFMNLEKQTAKRTQTILSWITTAVVIMEQGWAFSQISWQSMLGLCLAPLISICLTMGVSLKEHQPWNLAI
jgi:lipoprotein signal peptidase